MDSLKDIELATSDKVRYKDYVYSLVNSFRQWGITSMLTSEISEIFGSFTVSEYGISFVADNVILLRYVELAGRVARAVSMLKMRGSNHVKEIREYQIQSQEGVQVLVPFANYDSVLSGMPQPSHIPGVDLLPPATRRLLTIIDAAPGLSLERLAEIINEPPQQVNEGLEVLIQLGYVIRQLKDGKEVFKGTM
jgi:circadian clock protein KaiC